MTSGSAESAASVLMDRVLGVLSIAFVGAIAVALSPRAGVGPAIVRAARPAPPRLRGRGGGGLQRSRGGAGADARVAAAVADGAARRRRR